MGSLNLEPGPGEEKQCSSHSTTGGGKEKVCPLAAHGGLGPEGLGFGV